MKERIEAIWNGDRLIRDFGMELEEAREGYARVSVRVQERFLNAHNIGHGVLVFAVADAAFAVCVNATVDAVGAQYNMNVIRASRPGEKVTAESKAVHSGRQSIVVELSVTGEDGRLIAKGQATALPLPKREPKP